MEIEDIAALFEKHGDEFLKFENIPESERLNRYQDLCGIMKLSEIVARHSKDLGIKDRTGNRIISAGEHDEIYFNVDIDNIKALTEDEVIYLSRCGILLDEGDECLKKFV